MKAPICDFINKYVNDNVHRLHMPGHKGKCFLGCEASDITEVQGADALYAASGIIKESEENATAIFGSGATYYSCEGSSLSVRAMCYLARAYAVATGHSERLWVLAGRNAHSSFLSASVLLDFEITWLSAEGDSYLSGNISPRAIEKALSCVDNLPFCVYITSPDYLGNISDIEQISKVCKKYGVPLLVDNAHGAYLKFSASSKHPLDLGATMCCDSAHKTLPVLTGGSYLHISKDAPEFFAKNAKDALSLFGSSSPSYLILASLDNANLYLHGDYPRRLAEFSQKAQELKKKLSALGYTMVGDEMTKLTIKAKDYGYLGTELYSELYSKGIVCEFCDKDYLVMMLTPESGESTLDALYSVLSAIPKKAPISDTPPRIFPCKAVMSPREAYMSESEEIALENAVGRIMSGLSISCPPAVSVVCCGEEISAEAVEMLKYYGINKCRVVK